MKLYIGGCEYSFTEDELEYMYEAEGTEAVIYRQGSKVLKIYKNCCNKDRLAEEETLQLAKISTNRILMPKEIICDGNQKFIGYVMDFLLRYSNANIPKMKMKQFLEEVKLLSQDIENLSLKHVDIEDFNIDNMIYNGGIYLCDPGSYAIKSEKDTEVILEENKTKLNTFLGEEIFQRTISLTKREKNNLTKHFDDYRSGMLKMMIDEAIAGETVRTYVKRICN